MYNLDKIIDRRDTNSIKYQDKDVIPMWIADMDFSFPNEVKEALLKVVNTGVLGYEYIPDNVIDTIRDWYNNNYNINIESKHILLNTGVIAALSAILSNLLVPGEEVLFLTPCYNTFFSVCNKQGLKVIESEMKYQDNNYYIDYHDFEEKLKRANMRCFVLCNPHNPIGHIWEEEDLIKITELCHKYNVLVISDEIHGPITRPGYKYNSYLNYNDKAIVLASPSKPFNMAGLKVAFSISKDESLNKRLKYIYNRYGLDSINSFAIELLPTIYSKCDTWLKEVNEYIYNNYLLTLQFIKDNNLDLEVVYTNATYLLWINTSKYSDNSLALSKHLKNNHKLFIAEGSKYLGNGNNFIRLNVATNKETLLEGLKRLKEGLQSINR